MEIHKINVNKSDEVTLIAEKVIDAKHKEVLIAVPRFSKLAESMVNFRLLKREAEALGKKVIIESVDEKVIEFCKATGIECLNPFFTEAERQFSDIVTSKAKKEISRELAKPKKIDLRVQAQGEPQLIRVSTKAGGRRWLRLASLLIVIFTVIGGGLFFGLTVIPKADIRIIAAKTDWSYKNSVTAHKSVTAPRSEAAEIPGQIFTQKKNLQLSFPATGKRQISQKAKGTIIIYNGHSSTPQSLVASTRFVAPDGKIFRLVQGVTVPGAKVKDGKIESSSIDAQVLADKPGASYNIAPAAKFTIPGFAGSPKFNTFYGQSKEPMAGGFIGETAYPTDADIKNAKEISAKNLEEAVRNLLIVQLPDDFKLIDGALEFKLTNQVVDTGVNPEEKFSILSEAEASTMVFKESDLFDMLLGKIYKEAGPDFEVKSEKANYGTARFNVQKGELSFEVDYRAILAKKIDTNLLKTKIAGKSESDFKAMIFSAAGLESAKVSLWPLWVRSVTQNKDRITITVD